LVGAAIAALVTIADGGGIDMLGKVGVVILVLHLLEAGVLTPKIVGHRVGLSETGALFAVVAGGKLLGFVGVVLAVPIAATCAVLVRSTPRGSRRRPKPKTGRSSPSSAKPGCRRARPRKS
jgi:predicted PurR-regulated permease PerM